MASRNEIEDAGFVPKSFDRGGYEYVRINDD